MIVSLTGSDAQKPARNGHQHPTTGRTAARVGFVTCVHPIYDLPSVTKRRDAAIDELRKQGCDVVLGEAPRTAGAAAEVAASLKAQAVDLLVLFFCTWVAEDITLELARGLMETPVLIWALPYLDRDVPMPSPLTGLAATGSNIRRLGKPFVYMIGQVTAESLQKIARAARVAAVAGQLRRARFGLVGHACPGMVDIEVDETGLEKALGVTTIHLELDALIRAAGGASPERTERAAARLVSTTRMTPDVDERTLLENLKLYVGLKDLVEQNRLDAYCVRCWPELRDQHQITPCAAHALMSQEGIPSTCEIDLTGLITTFILARLAGSAAFNFDITGYLEEEGAIQFCHCGAADPSLAGQQPLLRSHMRTGTGATVEFPFKEGQVTLAKLVRPFQGGWKLFIAGGAVIAPTQEVRGSVALVKPEPSCPAFLDAMLREAVEHHIALVYGDWRADLEQFCTFTGLEYVTVSGRR